MTDIQSLTAYLQDFDKPVTLTDLKQIWRGRIVLDVPKLTLLPGRRYALLGANGSGKSTLMKMLSERITADNGQIGYLPQKPYTFALTVSNNVRLGIPQGLGLSRDEKLTSIRKQLESLNLSDLASCRGCLLYTSPSPRD